MGRICIGRFFVFILLLLLSANKAAYADGVHGYYRQPAINKNTVVFVAEGDLWKVGADGGEAVRLTSHPGEESTPAISPDGKTVAFVGHYEGPADVYTLGIDGGLPVRRTYDGERVAVVGWAGDGRILCSSATQSTLPDPRLMTLDIRDKAVASERAFIPLSQAAQGCYDDTGKTLFFTRFRFQGSFTKRYQGGTAQNIWKYTDGDAEAVPLTADFPGTSRDPMWWDGRVYFVSDRDGTMNLWSMKSDGSDLKQHTHHGGWDIAGGSLSDGRVVYQCGADLYRYDVAADHDQLLNITLQSDFDQWREHWVKKPLDYLGSAHISPDGHAVVLTARGEIFVAPQNKKGRLIEVTHDAGVRYRDARFMPDGKQLLTLSDSSGEFELWTCHADGSGTPVQLTSDGNVLRWQAIVSPDGKYIVHDDKNRRLFLYDVQGKANHQISESVYHDFTDLRWSPDSKWLAIATPTDDLFYKIGLYSVVTGAFVDVTTNRFNNFSPAWSADGKWLYLLSDRNLNSVVASPWGNYAPQPFFDKKTQIFAVALSEAMTRSPFAAKDELHAGDEDRASARLSDLLQKDLPAPKTVVDTADLQKRLIRLPLPAGNYSSLSVNRKALFYLSHPAGSGRTSLMGAEIGSDNNEPKIVVLDVKGYELSQDGKKLLVQKADEEGKLTGLYLIDAELNTPPGDFARHEIDLAGWELSVNPRDEWHSMFVDAWRMERDYFYDTKMHGVDWKAVRAKYEPLVDRVTDRIEFSDLLAQMISELSALHMFVSDGDFRETPDKIEPSSLGARLVRDVAAGGYRIEHIYQSDPDEPDLTGPLARVDVNAKDGDIIEQVNGQSTLDVADVGVLLRRQAKKQVRLRIKPAGGGPSRDVVVEPMDLETAANCRYHEWEYTRRMTVEDAGKGEIGYLHLRAMGGKDFTAWAKGFFPVFNRQGLIIDVRHNRGGNIDSWILGELLRKAWFFWTQRGTEFSTWNMQYAFRGHIVVLCDEFTASDGEAFTEGFMRLKLGKVIGTRTWGGEIWLSKSNRMVDNGIATAAEEGVYGPEGVFLIEGVGVKPDIVVDNLPHATYTGKDAQLAAAIELLQKEIHDDPIKPPVPPTFPDKSQDKRE